MVTVMAHHTVMAMDMATVTDMVTDTITVMAIMKKMNHQNHHG